MLIPKHSELYCCKESISYVSNRFCIAKWKIMPWYSKQPIKHIPKFWLFRYNQLVVILEALACMCQLWINPVIWYSGDICVCVWIYNSVERISMDRIRKHGTVARMLINDCTVNKSVFKLMKFNMYIASAIWKYTRSMHLHILHS